MKLQVDQIDSFDRWLKKTEDEISKNLENLEENFSGVERQYRQLARLQDELVAQQQITESLQNMVIVIEDTTSTPSDEIETKLLNLSERWAQICTFVQKRWIQLQEIKIELEQNEANREKIQNWLNKNEDEVTRILSEINFNDVDSLMHHVHSVKVRDENVRRRNDFLFFVLLEN